MSTYFRIEDQQIALSVGAKLIRAREYTDFHHAHEIVKRARAHEREILDASHQIYEQEKQRGYEEGMLRAQEERAHTVQKIYAQHAVYLQELEHSLHKTVSSTLNKIIGQIAPEALIVGMVQQALAKYTKKSAVKLIVNLELVESVELRIKAAIEGHPFVNHIQVIGDLNVPYDMCMLETRTEVIELSLQHQMDSIVEIMRQLQQQENS